MDAEWKILYDKLDKIVASGAKVVLSKLPIGDVATQYFADRDVFCAGRVTAEDMKRTMKACGGSVQSTVTSLEGNLGTCGKFEEVCVTVARVASALFESLCCLWPSRPWDSFLRLVCWRMMSCARACLWRMSLQSELGVCGFSVFWICCNADAQTRQRQLSPMADR